MKTTKILAILLALAAAGCGETTDLLSAHAQPLNSDVRCEYSGADRTYNVYDGTVYEYSSAFTARSERRKAEKVAYAVLNGHVFEYH